MARQVKSPLVDLGARKAAKLPDMKEWLACEGVDIDDSPLEVYPVMLKRDVEPRSCCTTTLYSTRPIALVASP